MMLTLILPGLRFFQWQGWTGLIACMLAESEFNSILSTPVNAKYDPSHSPNASIRNVLSK